MNQQFTSITLIFFISCIVNKGTCENKKFTVNNNKKAALWNSRAAMKRKTKHRNSETMGWMQNIFTHVTLGVLVLPPPATLLLLSLHQPVFFDPYFQKNRSDSAPFYLLINEAKIRSPAGFQLQTSISVWNDYYFILLWTFWYFLDFSVAAAEMHNFFPSFWLCFNRVNTVC